MALAFAQQVSGNQSAADSALKTLMDNYPNSVAYQIAEVYALRNDPNATFEWLDRAWSTRDPRFAAFCRKVGPARAG
jgi:hypothetical protein